MPCSECSKTTQYFFHLLSSHRLLSGFTYILRFQWRILHQIQKFFKKSYHTFGMERSRLFECAFAALLAALRRSSLYGVVRRKEKRPFVISNSMQPISGSFLRLLTVKHSLAHILRFLLPVPYKRSSALLHADTLFLHIPSQNHRCY